MEYLNTAIIVFLSVVCLVGGVYMVKNIGEF